MYMHLCFREAIRGTYARRTPLPPPETGEFVGGTDRGATIYTILNTVFALIMAIVCSLNMHMI